MLLRGEADALADAVSVKLPDALALLKRVVVSLTVAREGVALAVFELESDGAVDVDAESDRALLSVDEGVGASDPVALDVTLPLRLRAPDGVPLCDELLEPLSERPALPVLLPVALVHTLALCDAADVEDDDAVDRALSEPEPDAMLLREGVTLVETVRVAVALELLQGLALTRAVDDEDAVLIALVVEHALGDALTHALAVVVGDAVTHALAVCVRLVDALCVCVLQEVTDAVDEGVALWERDAAAVAVCASDAVLEPVLVELSVALLERDAATVEELEPLIVAVTRGVALGVSAPLAVPVALVLTLSDSVAEPVALTNNEGDDLDVALLVTVAVAHALATAELLPDALAAMLTLTAAVALLLPVVDAVADADADEERTGDPLSALDGVDTPVSVSAHEADAAPLPLGRALVVTAREALVE